MLIFTAFYHIVGSMLGNEAIVYKSMHTLSLSTNDNDITRHRHRVDMVCIASKVRQPHNRLHSTSLDPSPAKLDLQDPLAINLDNLDPQHDLLSSDHLVLLAFTHLANEFR
jgi:hypothetical protein